MVVDLLFLCHCFSLVPLFNPFPTGESAVACEEVQLRASQCLLLMGQFLGHELYDLLCHSTTCLDHIADGLQHRYEETGGNGGGRSSGSSRSGSVRREVSDRRIQSSMRIIQLLAFACESKKTFGTLLARHGKLVKVLQTCEQSNDGRDLRTAISGSWAGLSVSALAHVLNQKLRDSD